MSHGLYRPPGASSLIPPGASSLIQDLAAWQLVLPSSAGFTHLTAAEVFGWWLPARLPGLPVFVAMSRDQVRPKRSGLHVVRLAQPPPLILRAGVRVTDPSETLLACARDLNQLDLVILCDAALHLRSCTREDISLAAAPGRRGSPALRRALAMADGKAESAWESILRMLHITCGVPVEAQHVVTDAHGCFVARGDLWIVGTKQLHEYDGGVHRDPRQHRADLARDRRILDAGWTRRGYTSGEVLRDAASVLRAADAALRRPHRPELVRAWQALLADSMLSRSGAERVRLRWRARG